MNNNNVNKEYYDGIWGADAAFDYLQKSAGSRWALALIDEILDQIPTSGAPETILDMGCGIGYKTAQIAKHFPDATVLGLDFAESAIDAARNYWKYSNLTFSAADVMDIQSSKFDLICMFEVLEHIEKWEQMVDEIVSMSSRYIFFSFPTGRMRSYEVDIGHYRNFSLGEVEEYVTNRHHYKLIKKFNAGFPFFSPILRDLMNIFHNRYSSVTYHRMTFVSQTIHNVWFILLRYLSSRHIGDNCFCLFERAD